MSQPSSNRLEALHEMIDHCIKVKEIADLYGPPPLRELVELLILETGKHFAREMGRRGDEGGDQRGWPPKIV